MRIAQFIDTDSVGGAETVVMQLCRAIAGHGHEPLLLHFGNRHLERQCQVHGIAALTVPDHGLYKSVRTLPLFIRRFGRYLRSQRIDALHSHLLGAVAAAAPAAWLAGVRHVGTLHDSYTLAERPVYRHLLRLAELCGTTLVAVSHDLERFLRGRARFGSGLVTVYNGVQPNIGCPRDETRRRLGIARQSVVVICVARLVPLKAHARLLDAFARVATGRSVELLLAGDGPLRETLQQRAQALGITDRTHFLGSRDDVADLLRASDLFVLPSDTEGLSCSLLEAMAAGLPTLASRVGGNPELVDDGVNGYLVPPGDTPALQQALASLLDCGEMCQRFGREARRRAEQAFSLETMAGCYLELYRGDVSAGRTAPGIVRPRRRGVSEEVN